MLSQADDVSPLINFSEVTREQMHKRDMSLQLINPDYLCVCQSEQAKIKRHEAFAGAAAKYPI